MVESLRNQKHYFFFKKHGEKISYSEDQLRDFIASFNYALNDVYNEDETGLYYKAFPDSTFDGNTINECKKQMQRRLVT